MNQDQYFMLLGMKEAEIFQLRLQAAQMQAELEELKKVIAKINNPLSPEEDK